MSVSNIVQTGTPPLANYGILTGQLFLYARRRAAFESSKAVAATTERTLSTASSAASSSSLLCPNKCILLGGLGDGLLPVPYTSILEEACHANDWSLVQPVLSSSYLGFGHGSLDRDVNELEELLEYLMNHRNGKAFAIVGHSTGCQDAVCFLEKALPKVRETVKVVALQAPVSDREGSELEEGFFEKLATSEEMVKNDRGDDMLPRSHHWAPITAQRFVDLHSRGGKDDYFSSDYTNDELEGRLKHVGAPRGGNHPCLDVLVAFSGADQYVPAPIDKRKLTERLVDAMNSGGSGSNRVVAKALYIENGDHNLSDPGDARIFVDKFTELLEKASEI